MILVIGGRSKIGVTLIGELVARGQRVRALVRPGESKQQPPDPVEIVAGDLSDKDSLRSALSGVDRLFLLCGPNEQEVELNKNAIAVAKEAGIRLLVRSSILGSSPDSSSTFARDHGVCDAYLYESGVPHAIVRPNLFMQNIPETTIPGIDPSGRFYVNAGDARLSMSTPATSQQWRRRCSPRMGTPATATTSPDPGHFRTPTSPPLCPPRSIARSPMSTFPTRRRAQRWRDSDCRDGLSERSSSSTRSTGARDKHGYAAEVAETIRQLTGRAPRTLEQLLEQPVTTTA